jgi:hypothetical protein
MGFLVVNGLSWRCRICISRQACADPILRPPLCIPGITSNRDHIPGVDLCPFPSDIGIVLPRKYQLIQHIMRHHAQPPSDMRGCDILMRYGLLITGGESV